MAKIVIVTIRVSVNESIRLFCGTSSAILLSNLVTTYNCAGLLNMIYSLCSYPLFDVESVEQKLQPKTIIVEVIDFLLQKIIE